VSGVDLVDVSAHFVQFTNLLGGAPTKRSFMQLLWLVCVWVLWTERNNRQFNNHFHSPVFRKGSNIFLLVDEGS